VGVKGEIAKDRRGLDGKIKRMSVFFNSQRGLPSEHIFFCAGRGEFSTKILRGSHVRKLKGAN